MSNREICSCLGITEDQVIEAVKAGATDVEKVGEATGAGTACGACLEEIQTVIDENK